MQTKNRFFAGAMATLFIAGTALTPIAANASEDGRKNTALGLGALTGYLFTRGGSKVPAFVGLAGTAYAYKRYQDSVSARHKRERAAKDRHLYRSGYRAGYKTRRHR